MSQRSVQDLKRCCRVALAAIVACGLVLCGLPFLQTVGDSAFAATVDNASDTGFAVLNSNSTYSEPILNQITRKVTFTVTGSNGTSGYIWCTISESLVPDHNDFSKQVAVFVDGNQTSYMYSFDDGAWELFFEYTHSTHEVVVSLPVEAGFLGIDFSVWAAILVVVCVLLVAVVWRRKRIDTRSGA